MVTAAPICATVRIDRIALQTAGKVATVPQRPAVRREPVLVQDSSSRWPAGVALTVRSESIRPSSSTATTVMPPKLMAGARRSGRERGKSDCIDALAVARAASREPDLPVDRLERELANNVASLAPTLLALPGCGPLTAASLVGEAAGISPIRNSSAFARHFGSTPVSVWPTSRGRHRPSRVGNRQVNTGLQRIAITQMRREGPGRDYIAKRRAVGDTTTEASGPCDATSATRSTVGCASMTTREQSARHPKAMAA